MNPLNFFEGKILSKPRFLQCLHLEKARVNRSKVPVSIALFYLQDGHPNPDESHQAFASHLLRSTRETDIKGWVERDVIGLILPDTDEKGARRCVDKIVEGENPGKLSVVVGTYPDDLFEKLLSENHHEPDLFPLEIEGSHKLDGLPAVLKRGIDIIGSLAGILLFSPVMLLTALAIKWDSAGPAIFRQIRYGKKGGRFTFLKFRSMTWEADDKVHRDYVSNLIKGDHDKVNQGDAQESFFKMKNDTRITRVGRLIRKTSIDELPQFFNVLKGEMSLVGPRPPVSYEIEKYEPWHLRRILEVKPGLTGLWQVEGRSKTSFDDMVRLDLRYVQSWSLWLDFKILAKTVKAVIHSKGAV